MDLVLFGIVLALLGIGVVMIYSASAVKAMMIYGDSTYFLKRQLLWSAIGLGGLLVASRVDYRVWARYHLVVLAMGILLLLLVLVPGVGRQAYGARRWLGVGPLGFQPSEAMKPAFVVFLASHLAARREVMGRFWAGMGPALLVTGACAGLILLQPDLGTAVSLCITCAVLLFVAGARVSHLMMVAAGSAPLLYWAVVSEQYRLRRVLAFLDPWADPQGAGFHIIQSLYAIGSGGLFGVGLGASRQKFFYLPAEHTDFIFAILGEELGFVGGLLVLGLFLVLAWRGYRVAMAAPDLLGCLLAGGMTSMVVLQALINIGVVTGSLPVTGIPLPLVSFGGSSLVFSLGGLGILLSVSRYGWQG